MQSQDRSTAVTSRTPSTTSRLDARQLIELDEDRGDTRLSLYLPLPAGRPDPPRTRILTKNLLAHAERALRADGLRAAAVNELVDTARHQIESALATSLPGAGLAVFAGGERGQSLRVPLRLPTMVAVGDSYAVGPLLPLLRGVDRFFTLGLSQDEIRLYEGDRFHLARMDLEGLEIASWLTMPPPAPPQVHAFVAGRGGSATQPMFHGTDGGDEDRKTRLLQHMRGVDRALRAVVDDPDAPLVLAGVRSLQALYRRANSHPNLLPEGIDGNPRDLRLDVLHQQSWAIAKTVLRREESAALLRYADLRGRGRTLEDTDDVLTAANQGRVETLLVAAETGGPGNTANGTPVIRRQATRGVAEHLERAAVATLRHGGAVFALPASRLPGSSPVAAALRY